MLGSGTCGNGGCLAELWGRGAQADPPPLRPGDVVELTVEGIGTVRNRVVPGLTLPPVREARPRPIPRVENARITGGYRPRGGDQLDEKGTATVFEYFPGNYVWNLAVVAALNSGGLIDEVDRACRPIREAAARGADAGTEDFLAAWTDLTDQLEAAGRVRAGGRARQDRGRAVLPGH